MPGSSRGHKGLDNAPFAGEKAWLMRGSLRGRFRTTMTLNRPQVDLATGMLRHAGGRCPTNPPLYRTVSARCILMPVEDPRQTGFFS